MVYKLTDNIWWGNADSPKEVGNEVGAVLCLCDNREFKGEQFNPLDLPAHTPYFRLTRHDDVAPDTAYMLALNGIIDITTDMKPILIHCWAGQHRSPNTALYTAVRRSGYSAELYKTLRGKMLSLRSDIQWRPFGKYLDDLMQRVCKVPPIMI